jgi:hypothetical protein
MMGNWILYTCRRWYYPSKWKWNNSEKTGNWFFYTRGCSYYLYNNYVNQQWNYGNFVSKVLIPRSFLLTGQRLIFFSNVWYEYFLYFFLDIFWSSAVKFWDNDFTIMKTHSALRTEACRTAYTNMVSNLYKLALNGVRRRSLARKGRFYTFYIITLLSQISCLTPL